MSDQAERFAALRGHFGGLSQREAAKRFGIAKNTWQRYEAGQLPGGDLLKALAEEGIDTNWLLTGDGTMLRPRGVQEAATAGFGEIEASPMSRDALERAGFVLIPRYDVKASAGGGAIYEDQNLLAGVAFRREWLHTTLHANPADLLVIEAKGDSMPGVADDGSLLLLNRSEPKFRGDGAYVFVVDDLLLVKNLRVLLDGSLEVTSSDEHQSTKDVIARKELDKVRIVGRVVWKGDRT